MSLSLHLSPLMLLRSGCPLRLTDSELPRSRPLRAYSRWENRTPFEVSQSTEKQQPLRALQPLVQQTSSGPAVTWRTVNELLLQSPLCQVGCATFPEAFTLLPSLGDDRPGRLDFQKTSLSHL